VTYSDFFSSFPDGLDASSFQPSDFSLSQYPLSEITKAILDELVGKHNFDSFHFELPVLFFISNICTRVLTYHQFFTYSKRLTSSMQSPITSRGCRRVMMLGASSAASTVGI
jgi:hypothetical protein